MWPACQTKAAAAATATAAPTPASTPTATVATSFATMRTAKQYNEQCDEKRQLEMCNKQTNSLTNVARRRSSVTCSPGTTACPAATVPQPHTHTHMQSEPVNYVFCVLVALFASVAAAAAVGAAAVVAGMRRLFICRKLLLIFPYTIQIEFATAAATAAAAVARAVASNAPAPRSA